MQRDWTLPLCRSYLYAPATKPELYEKALVSEADAVTIDLEDGVAESRKTEARELVSDLLRADLPKPVFVRINSLESGLAEADIEALAGLAITGVRIPKVRRAEEVAQLCQRLRDIGFEGGVQLQIERAEGVLNLPEIARADSMIEFIGIGERDLSIELGCARDNLDPIRMQLLLVSRAHGLRPPIQGSFGIASDLDEYEQSTLAGKQAGFFGRMTIHPSHIDVIHRVYTPSRQEVDYARDALERLVAITREGQTTTRDQNGDYLSVWYRTVGEGILELARQFGTREDQ
ncbi:MAG: CoA ester lyase [Pseudomonadota bacterium]